MSTMTKIEKRATISLSSILGLRMFGLFMVLPLFSLYALQLKGATPFLVGLAIGIYGLSQAICQIPFGTLSDYIGRKPMIIVGLLLFALGSLLAGFAHHIIFMIIGRALQGCGAIGGTLLAMLSDLTREEKRTSAMAIAGITIGLSFTLSLLCGPLLMKWLSVNDIFFLAAFLAIVCILILLFLSPTPIAMIKKPFEWKTFRYLATKELIRLNIGILILHTVFTASFIVIPISLFYVSHIKSAEQWTIYLPTLLIALTTSLFLMKKAEKNRRIKFYFLFSILLLASGLFLLSTFCFSLLSIYLALITFFTGFSLLEAFLPSLISKCAPPQFKGSALGCYSCAQFLGIFLGGVIGGILYGQFSFTGVYCFCMMLTLSWFVIATFMESPSYLVTDLLHLASVQPSHWNVISAKLQSIPGMKEITFITEDKLAYLKMEPDTKTHPDFISLKEMLSQHS